VFVPVDPNHAIELVQWLTGKWISRAIHAAAELSLADILAEGALDLDELARRTQTHAPSLYRLLRALSSIGLFRECSPRRFELTERGALLKRDAMRAACLMAHSAWHDAAWSELLHSVRTGESGFERAHGQQLFDWLSQHREEAQVFDATMTAGKAYRDLGIADCYDFSAFSRLVDVGGGQGSLTISILQRYPQLSAIVADLPHVIPATKLALERAGLAERCEAVASNFFEAVPAGADAYVLAHILHDWDDAACERILTCCRNAMSARSKLLLVEALVPHDDAPNRLKWLDLEMLVLTSGGRERTADEYRQLLRTAGFELTRIEASGGSRCLLEASVA
jgi:hypothetical protein